ncbi:MAG: D-alanyl-D-alanine carboxypeptidase family protein [bacterium]
MQVICSIGFGLWILVFACGAKALESDPFPKAAKSYLLQVNGTTLWAHKPDHPLPPASLTKIMTALLVLEKSRLDKVVSISHKACRETGIRLGLKRGDKMYVIDLLAATLLQSANDACYALAEHVTGGEKQFVALMNQRARELGLNNTHFTNACGHDQKGFYSTAYDLARLTDVALKNPTFAKLVSLVKGEVSTVDGKRSFIIENKNEIIGRYPGAIGVKTGFTKQAGKCLIALAEQDETRVLLVLLNSPDRWWTAVAMLDKAFAYASKLKVK